MSVFLRWGVFGILGVAALLYAYNASKRLAEARAAKPAPVAVTEVESEPADESDAAAAPEATSEDRQPPAAAAVSAPSAPAHCEAELVVAQRAIDLRKEGAPLDRALRIQEIAWEQSPERRQRLEQVATRWFGYEGDFRPEALRIAVINDCEHASPAP